MRVSFLYFFLICSFTNCKGQKSFGSKKLTLVKEIPMPSVKGRIDHMAFNLKNKMLYVAALGNNTVEVIDLQKGSIVHSIEGVEEPQGLAYIPDQNEIAVASGGNGDCVFYNASTFKKLAMVHLPSDADNIRYDAEERKLYVGYGNGGMAVIDPTIHKQIGDVKLSAHPESFQLDKKNKLLFANLPDDHSIAVIDLKSLQIAHSWKMEKLRANFPMTLDTTDNLVIVGFRHPATLVAFDNKTGKQISQTDLVGDVDDLFYNMDKKQLIASGGDGSINVFQKTTDNRFQLVSSIATRQGARTSLLITSLQYFILANRAEGNRAASISVFKID
jgi:DNA-binding beta-propeller fold protein YncE